MNIHIVNPLQSLTKHTFTTRNLYDVVKVIMKPTHMCGHIIDWPCVNLATLIKKRHILMRTAVLYIYIFIYGLGCKHQTRRSSNYVKIPANEDLVKCSVITLPMNATPKAI